MHEVLYNMMLSMVDPKNNHQKYYQVKLEKISNEYGTGYVVATYYGRMVRAIEDASKFNRKSVSGQVFQYTTEAEAKRKFDEIVETRYKHGYTPTLQTD